MAAANVLWSTEACEDGMGLQLLLLETEGEILKDKVPLVSPLELDLVYPSLLLLVSPMVFGMPGLEAASASTEETSRLGVPRYMEMDWFLSRQLGLLLLLLLAGTLPLLNKPGEDRSDQLPMVLLW